MVLALIQPFNLTLSMCILKTKDLAQKKYQNSLCTVWYFVLKILYLHTYPPSKPRAVARGGQGGGQLPWTSWAREIKSVLRFSLFKGFVFFRLSYFDCSDVQLFAIFMDGKSVDPRCVQMVSKTKQNSLLRLACTICTVHSRLIYGECLELAWPWSNTI